MSVKFNYLFIESVQYIRSLVSGLGQGNYSAYRRRLLVNTHYKFDSLFYDSQKQQFLANPDGYMLGNSSATLTDNIISRNVPTSILIRTLLKAVSHIAFRFIGQIQSVISTKKTYRIIRKSYVEDVEALFDIDCDLRIVYPFPLSIQRQIKYIKFIRDNKFDYRLDGLDYSIYDILKFLAKPTVLNFVRLEIRASIRTALAHNLKLDPDIVQSSDEYDFGAPYYTRIMNRLGVQTHNSAHGVGKYLPNTQYSHFDCLTDAQIEYYRVLQPQTKYCVRAITRNAQKFATCVTRTSIVFLGQAINNDFFPFDEENQVICIMKNLAKKFSSNYDFYYKPHPNYALDSNDIGQLKLVDGLISGPSELIYQFSFFSTCFIDDNFIGTKFLVSSRYIKPQFCFGEKIFSVDISNLEKYIELILLERARVSTF